MSSYKLVDSVLDDILKGTNFNSRTKALRKFAANGVTGKVVGMVDKIRKSKLYWKHFEDSSLANGEASNRFSLAVAFILLNRLYNGALLSKKEVYRVGPASATIKEQTVIDWMTAMNRIEANRIKIGLWVPKKPYVSKYKEFYKVLRSYGYKRTYCLNGRHCFEVSYDLPNPVPNKVSLAQVRVGSDGHFAYYRGERTNFKTVKQLQSFLDKTKKSLKRREVIMVNNVVIRRRENETLFAILRKTYNGVPLNDTEQGFLETSVINETVHAKEHVSIGNIAIVTES